MSKKSHHVVPNSNGGWNVKKAGSKRSSGHYETKKEAIKSGRSISKNQNTEFVIHGKNGKIQRKASHGNDPNPPRDRDTH